MRIAVIALGSRGDVEPYVALGLGLRAAGHEVSLGAGLDFREFVTARGLAFQPVAGDMHAALNTPAGLAMLKTSNPVEFVRRLRATAEPLLATMQEDIRAATAGADACVFSYLSGPVIDIHEATGLPAFMGMLQPLVPTRQFPNPITQAFNLGSLNKPSYYFFNALMLWMFGEMGNRWRRERFGLPPVRTVARLERLRLPQLCAISPAVIPRPADWPDYAQMTGYWFMPSNPNWQPPAELAAFLAEGDPPVAVSFGSMLDEDPAGLSQTVEQALELAGRRAVLIGGWGKLEQTSGKHLCLSSVPYEWLLPRVAAFVHHGGAGTTAITLRAGIPAVIVPYFGDQPWWARLVRRLGACATPVPRARLTAQRLAQAIQEAVSAPSIRRRARELGAIISQEDGVGNAVRFIESNLRQRR